MFKSGFENKIMYHFFVILQFITIKKINYPIKNEVSSFIFTSSFFIDLFKVDALLKITKLVPEYHKTSLRSLNIL